MVAPPYFPILLRHRPQPRSSSASESRTTHMGSSFKRWFLADPGPGSVTVAPAPWFRRLSIPSCRSRRLFFAAIVLVAFAVRLWGIGWGLPYVEHPDEPQVADAALGMAR